MKNHSFLLFPVRSAGCATVKPVRKGASHIPARQIALPALIVVSFGLLPRAEALDYFRYISLGNLQPVPSEPFSYRSYKMNASGSVVGNVDGEAAIWKAGVATKQGVPPIATYSHGYAINASDAIAIQRNNQFFAEENSAAVKYQGTYYYTSFPPNTRYTVPYGINDSRLMVGAASVGAGIPGPAFFVPAGGDVPTLLPNAPGTAYSVALDVNNNKIACGVSFLGVNNPIAITWVADGSGNGQVLGNASGSSSAQDVNDNNVAVGHYGTYAVYWDNSGIHGITNGIANAVTNSGMIVGSTNATYNYSISEAWFKSPTDTTVYSLSALQNSGHALYTASDINTNLQIVGLADTGGYMLTPVIERSVSGVWNDSSKWLWSLQPGAVHPVRIVPSTANVTVAGPAGAATVSEVTVGYATGTPIATLDLATGSTLQVAGNLWGNGKTTVAAKGSVIVDGQLQSPVDVSGLLSGSGAITGNVGVKSTGTLSPGRTTGTLSTAELAMEGGSHLRIDINGQGGSTVADKLIATSGVSLSDASLDFSGNHVPAVGETFVIIQNNSAQPVAGKFKNLPEGTRIAHFMGSALDGRISYTGGDGNDVAIATIEPLSNNADLASLTLVPGPLLPSFSAATSSYTAEVNYEATSTTVTSVAVEPQATVSTNGKPASTAGQTETLPLVVGANHVDITVTAPDSATIHHYFVEITRLSILQMWRKDQFGSTSGQGEQADLADFDGDGQPNLLELAMGTDPKSGLVGPLVYSGGSNTGGVIEKTGQPVVILKEGENRALFIRLSSWQQASLAYNPMASADCESWQPISGEPEILADNGVYQVVSVPIPSFGEGTPAFFRLGVSLAE